MPTFHPFDPLDLDDEAGYRRWRDWKLAARATDAADLVVDVADPRHLRPAERVALLERCARENMAVYRCARTDMERDLPLALGRQLGLTRLDHHWLTVREGVSLIAAGAPDDERSEYIPYTDRAIRWHTDGYYNAPEATVHGMILHCVRPAAQGGENALLDHELLYIALRDEDPRWIAALASPAAMTIPARWREGEVAREAQVGPVFSREPLSGALHLRYTARTRSIAWADDAVTRDAAARIAELLADDRLGVRRIRLDAGMGLVANNVLHDRTGFVDDSERPRLLLRARFRDRITSWPERAVPSTLRLEPACPIA